MDGEHIEIMIDRFPESDTKKQAIIELGNMREELYVLRKAAEQKRSISIICPTCGTFIGVDWGKRRDDHGR